MEQNSTVLTPHFNDSRNHKILNIKDYFVLNCWFLIIQSTISYPNILDVKK